MIKAKELRIGNWVKRDSQPNGFKIDSRSFFIIEQHPDWYDPIPFTPEILEKAGFVDGKKDRFKAGYDSDDFVQQQMSVVFDSTMVKLKHLHRFQNLYFDLTGEELKIEL